MFSLQRDTYSHGSLFHRQMCVYTCNSGESEKKNDVLT